MEIQSVSAGDRPFINSYSAGGFTISGRSINGGVLVLPDTAEAWSVSNIDDLTVEHLNGVAGRATGIEVLLIGCGPKMLLLPRELRDSFRAFNFSVDVMETGAACRTFNVLISESRRVAAAMVPIG
ncbi:MAG: Mth938-like domain-containing protein [Pseudomonadota bacterium]